MSRNRYHDTTRKRRHEITEDDIADHALLEPVIKRCDNRGWLAVSPPECLFAIGVFAWSAEDARNKWIKARDARIPLMRDIIRDPDFTTPAA